MRKYLILLIASLFFSFVVSAQGAPDAINTAIADLSTRVGATLSINNLENWFWSQSGYTDFCEGGTPPADVVGYQFLLTYNSQVYDYRVTADGAVAVLCGVTGVDAATPEPDQTQTNIGDSEYSNPLCPQPPAGIAYPRTRLVSEIQARVLPGLPNNFRDNPSVNGNVIGEIPGSGIFTVMAGPSCDEEGRLWWQVNYDGAVGYTAETNVDGTYLLEPVPGLGLSAERSTITVENVENVVEISRLQGNLGTGLAFLTPAENSPVQSLIALGGTGNESAMVYDITQPSVTARSLTSDARLTSVVATSDPNLVILGDVEGALRFWDVSANASLVERAFLTGHDSAISAIALSPDGTRVLTSGGTAFLTPASDANQYAIVIWDVDSVSQVGALRGHTADVTAIDFGPPGQVASASLDGTVRLWNINEPSAPGVIVDLGSPVNDLTYHNDLSILSAVRDDGVLSMIDPQTGVLIASYPLGFDPVTHIVANNGGLLVTANVNGEISFWDVNSLSASNPVPPLLTSSGHLGKIYDMAFSPDFATLATLGEDNTIRFWGIR